MISLQELHLTQRHSGTWTRRCSTACLGLRIFLNQAISIRVGLPREPQFRRHSGIVRIAARPVKRKGEGEVGCPLPGLAPGVRGQVRTIYTTRLFSASCVAVAAV